ncbi:hypothetical protein BX666DRAFT_1976655 [Dichotomocladium elegans]|nr:hypothetical protein BX666DRAFT_1976655 [Dichotomocladium elegans]
MNSTFFFSFFPPFPTILSSFLFLYPSGPFVMLVAVALPIQTRGWHYHHHHRPLLRDTLLLSRVNSETSSDHQNSSSSSSSSSNNIPHQVRMVPCLMATTTPSRGSGVHFDVIEREVNPGIPLEVGRFTDNLFIPHRISFRSKVVSRKHAVLWVEHGKLFIRDTKSSSGTFINNIRLSPSNKESKPYELRDGDIIQFGTDYRGGAQDSCRSVRLRLELDRKVEHKVDWFSFQSYQSLRQLTQSHSLPAVLDMDDGNCSSSASSRSSSSSSSHSSCDESPAREAPAHAQQLTTEAAAAQDLMKDCCICLYAVAPLQALFVAPCQHTFHYKCIRPLLNHYPGFQCPVCRGYADLESSVAIEPQEVLEMLSKLKDTR